MSFCLLQKIRIPVCCEEVETEEQLTFLKEYKCDKSLRYLFSY